MRILILLALAALLLPSCKYREVSEEIGYKGKARVNPWLAAERFTALSGRGTESVVSWTAPQWDDAVWFMPAATLSNESFIRQTEEWTREGGHLVLLVEHADAQTNDWNGTHISPEFEASFDAFLDRVGLDLTSSKTITRSEIKFKGKTYKVNASSEYSVKTEKGQEELLASVKAGSGRVTVVTDARIFRNRWIDENEHAALLAALVNSTANDGTVGFMRGSGLSLWGMLRLHLTPVLLGLLVLVLLWLWKNLSRFGPVEADSAPSELKGYEHHLEALGDFQWRRDKAASLLTPLREQIVELGQRTSARVGRRDEDFFQFLGDRAGIPRERVFRALAEKEPADPAVLTRTTADLQQLLKVLHHPSQP